eukprot:767990-Hanusia_phi.AAC.7
MATRHLRVLWLLLQTARGGPVVLAHTPGVPTRDGLACLHVDRRTTSVTEGPALDTGGVVVGSSRIPVVVEAAVEDGDVLVEGAAEVLLARVITVKVASCTS